MQFQSFISGKNSSLEAAIATRLAVRAGRPEPRLDLEGGA